MFIISTFSNSEFCLSKSLRKISCFSWLIVSSCSVNLCCSPPYTKQKWVINKATVECATSYFYDFERECTCIINSKKLKLWVFSVVCQMSILTLFPCSSIHSFFVRDRSSRKSFCIIVDCNNWLFNIAWKSEHWWDKTFTYGIYTHCLKIWEKESLINDENIDKTISNRHTYKRWK